MLRQTSVWRQCCYCYGLSLAPAVRHPFVGTNTTTCSHPLLHAFMAHLPMKRTTVGGTRDLEPLLQGTHLTAFPIHNHIGLSLLEASILRGISFPTGQEDLPWRTLPPGGHWGEVHTEGLAILQRCSKSDRISEYEPVVIQTRLVRNQLHFQLDWTRFIYHRCCGTWRTNCSVYCCRVRFRKRV